MLRNHTRQERWARECRLGCQDRLEKIGITIQGVMTASEQAGGIPTGNYSNRTVDRLPTALVLFADAEAGKDPSQEVIGAKGARDLTQ